jgi:hypothetical protein
MAKSARDLRRRAVGLLAWPPIWPGPDAFEDNPMPIPYGAKGYLSNSKKP